MSPPKTARRACFYAGEDYDMSASVGHLLSKVMSSMRREADSRMASLDLTDAQWKPLWMLRCGRADTAFELAREMDIDAGAMTRTLDRLEAKGLIERVRSETDRRVVHLRLTPEGDRASAEVPHVLAEVNNDHLQGFSKSEWTLLRDLLQKMLDNGEALRAAAAAKEEDK